MVTQMQLPIAAQAGRDGAETRLKGLSISSGLGMGRARIVGDLLEVRDEIRSIQKAEIEGELGRIRAAFEAAREELEQSAQRIEKQFSPALADIFRAHEMMLAGLQTSRDFEQEVRTSLVKAEIAVRRVFRRLQDRFRSLRGETFQQRIDDVADIGRKVLRHLEGDLACPLKDLPAGSVLVCQRLLPSDVVPLSHGRIAAIVVESLGRGSHAALLARSKSIPAAAQFPGLLEQVRAGDELLVDGYRGEIIIRPKAGTRAEFQERLDKLTSTQVRCQGLCREQARTLDGLPVRVEANVSEFEDIQLALENGADGVGLFRIEELYLTRELPPTEEELFHELRALTSPLQGKPLTLRLLDLGGDKSVPFLRLPAEDNRLLGRRGVRLLLEYPELARTQLASLLRLAQEQPIRVLVPMVTLEDDMRAIRAMFEAVCAELDLPRRPALGAMVETPAAALNVSAIARHADFLSIGTNDLTQYTLAAGRDDPAVDRYYQDDHASVLRLLRLIIAEAGLTSLTLCGELAGREEMIPALLSMGLRSFSVSPPLIPGIKELIRRLRVAPVARPQPEG